MEIVRKIMPMRLFFSQLFALERKQIAFMMASQKSHPRISDCLFATSRSEMEISVYG
ncbi:MAG: hypothetical protein SOV90_10200 [Lachnospiraceae bacterium]|nr:hypothetical protein [Lachnospiraceae bacterium]